MATVRSLARTSRAGRGCTAPPVDRGSPAGLAACQHSLVAVGPRDPARLAQYEPLRRCLFIVYGPRADKESF